VGFENETSFVLGTDADKLEKLNSLIQRGGEPIGFVGFVVEPDGRGAMVKTSLLDEYADAEWAQNYLDSLAASFSLAMEAKGLGRVEPGEH